MVHEVHLHARAAILTRQLSSIHRAARLQRAVAISAQADVMRVATITIADTRRCAVRQYQAAAVLVTVQR